MSFSGSPYGNGGGGGSGSSSVVVEATPGASASTINSLIAGVAGTIGERDGGGRVLLPAGTYNVDTPILIKQHVVLEGEGPGTMLVNDGLAAGEAVIQTSSDGDRRFCIRNLTIDATDADYGIHLDTPSTSPQEYADGIYTISDIEIFDADLDGVWLEGRGQAIVRNMRVRDSGRHGYVIDAVDSIYDGLEAGGCGSAGIVVRGSNNRLANCKTFYSGAITAADGHGIWFDGSTSGGQHCVMSNCETQDNNAHGVYIDTFGDVRIEGHISEGNNAGNYSAANQGGCGYYVDASSDVRIEGSAFGRLSNAQDQRYAIGLANGAENLKAIIYSKDNQTGHIQNGWHWATDIRINNYDGNQAVSYSASRTPDPTLGRKILIGPLSGNITINNVSGSNWAVGHEMIIMVLQNGTGGYTVTWGSEYATGGYSPTTTANYLNTYHFVRDDAAWVLVGARAMDYTAFA